ncbi:hypothetical protein WJX81_007595 [Elliptochloris bilobata]|uniref:ABC transporter domain-containing protein n=1 Tax=Elliptochloris bilobata TaxID=381761 RepID=A0AAW1RK23_9CHLO
MLVQYPASLQWLDLACQVVDPATHVRKQILLPSSGEAVPGEIVAIIGPSGAGKSTLLDILSQRKGGRVCGQVLMNGLPLGKAFQRHCAYVPQEDTFVPTLSAWETLKVHARLRSQRGTPAAEVHARTLRALAVMGLWRVRNTQVGGVLPGGIRVRGLSGGEQRRLSIACALVAQPSILFLDEPTTGLDSFAALNIMDHMSCLAALGHTIIATLHQPRTAIWDMLHKARVVSVVVMSEGAVVYAGPPERAAAWFCLGLGYSYERGRDGSLSDWLMDLVSVRFAKPSDLAGRSVTFRKESGGLIFYDLPETPGAIFQRLATLFFLVLLYDLLPFCYMSFYVADRKFYAADVAAGLYHSSAYYAAQGLAGAPFVCLNTLVGALAAYGLAGLRPDAWAVAQFALVLVLQSLVAIQVMDMAYIILTGYISAAILLSGFFMRMSACKIRPLVWLSYLSFPRRGHTHCELTMWSLHGVARVELGGRDFWPPGCGPGSPPAGRSETGGACRPTHGDTVLSYWEFTLGVGQVLGVLLAFYAVLHAASYIALARLYRQRR